jgi:growth hormone-inducible transmembrane protein
MSTDSGLGMMYGTIYTSPSNTVQKHAFWGGFQLAQGLFIAPLYFFSPAVLARAALYTVGMVGSLSYISATAKTDQYLYLGGPLLAGLTIVVLSSFAPLVLPATAFRTLAITDTISLYGGLAVFGGFILYDTQAVMARARRGVRDPVAESISLELDAINIFIRLVYILGGRNRQK